METVSRGSAMEKDFPGVAKSWRTVIAHVMQHRQTGREAVLLIARRVGKSRLNSILSRLQKEQEGNGNG
jgi:hypothetical protein